MSQILSETELALIRALANMAKNQGEAMYLTPQTVLKLLHMAESYPVKPVSEKINE